jgi:hypothetical protein
MAAERPVAAAVLAEDVRPPFGSWRRLYMFILAALLVEILGLWVVARTFG